MERQQIREYELSLVIKTPDCTNIFKEISESVEIVSISSIEDVSIFKHSKLDAQKLKGYLTRAQLKISEEKDILKIKNYLKQSILVYSFILLNKNNSISLSKEKLEKLVHYLGSSGRILKRDSKKLSRKQHKHNERLIKRARMLHLLPLITRSELSLSINV